MKGKAAASPLLVVFSKKGVAQPEGQYLNTYLFSVWEFCVFIGAESQQTEGNLPLPKGTFQEGEAFVPWDVAGQGRDWHRSWRLPAQKGLRGY